jgi:signal transduction histidine kinase
MRAGVERMNTLIDDLLRLARTTRAEMHPQPVDLSALASAMAAKLQSEQNDRKVEWVIPPGLTVRGDAGLLQVALENLLSNAWKYTSRTPEARIELGMAPQPDGSSAFFVRDNGAGFDMKYAHRLFAPFQRLHSERDFTGTGVGLATVQRIIHKHGGRIWPQAAPNQGATFFFTIPPPAGS